MLCVIVAVANAMALVLMVGSTATTTSNRMVAKRIRQTMSIIAEAVIGCVQAIISPALAAVANAMARVQVAGGIATRTSNRMVAKLT
jgi:hypothetical protein